MGKGRIKRDQELEQFRGIEKKLLGVVRTLCHVNREGIDNAHDIVSLYAIRYGLNSPTFIAGVCSRAGFGFSDKLDLISHPGQLDALVCAIADETNEPDMKDTSISGPIYDTIRRELVGYTAPATSAAHAA